MTEEALFHAVLAVPPRERAAYLASHCPDHELRRRVEELLAAHDQPAGPLDASPATGEFKPGSESAIRHPQSEIRQIGPYKLLQRIGEGGMGAVYMAEQQHPVRRMVAVKVIKPGMDSAQVVARFEAERQALAMMDHPNISKVFDAGTTEQGHPFFVMELVKGVPITKYCDQQHLTPRERLQLFIPVCQAVQHAHQKGIIHRDLKPTNVLVALYDGRPVPKVIDFGVAKATGGKLTDRTMFTEYGAIVGTLEYMSPEQAELNQLDIDTRSDIYSLGVLLYELLTGSTPFDRKRLNSAAFDELLRIIREEEPPKPSTRLSGSEELPSIAANRRTEPKRLGKLVRGELDWVVMKCLEKDRARRYETANGLAMDVQRYLADDMVQARPPTAGYRLRKFWRRHKGPVLATVAFVTLLAAATGVSLWLATVAHEKEAAAVSARNDLRTANDELKRSEDQLESALARSLSRPFLDKGGDLTDPEAEARWELARNPGEKLWLRFVDEGTRTPEAAARFRERAESAWIAAVGLDPARRIRAEQLLAARLGDPSLAATHRVDIALATIELTPSESPTNRLCAAILLDYWSGTALNIEGRRSLDRLMQKIEKESDYLALGSVAEKLAAITARLDHDAAARVCGLAARRIADALANEAAEGRRELLAMALAAVTPRLQPEAAARFLPEALSKGPNAIVRASTAEALAAVAGQLSPEEAARACRPAAQLLAEALSKETTDDRLSLAKALAAVTGHIPPEEAARICGPVARLLAETLAKAEGYNDASKLAASLAEVTRRLPPDEAGTLNGPAIQLLAQGAANQSSPPEVAWRVFVPGQSDGLSAMADQVPTADVLRVCRPAALSLAEMLVRPSKDHVHLWFSARGLAAVSARLPPGDAARLCRPAAVRLAESFAKGAQPNPYLADGLAALTPRLPRDEAAKLCEPVARAIAASLVNRSPSLQRPFLVWAFTSTAGQLPPDEAARITSGPFRAIRKAISTEQNVTFKAMCSAELVGLCPFAAPEEAHQAVIDIVRQVASTGGAGFDDRSPPWDAEALDALLLALPPSRVRPRAIAVATTIGQAMNGSLAALPTLPLAAEPLPCRLATQELVELLKMPTCYGEVRKVILKHLGSRYGRRFADHWEFVEFAQAHNLKFDFTTPPVRYHTPETAAR